MRYCDARFPGFRLSYLVSQSVDKRLGLHTAQGVDKSLSPGSC